MGFYRSTRLEVNVAGDREFGRELLGMSSRALNMRPAFEEIIELLRDWARSQYRTHGLRSGEVWAPLKAATLKLKMKRGLDPGILLASHDLYNSLTTNDQNAIAEVDDDEMTFGSKLDYFKFHQSRKPRKSNLPRRPIVGLIETDKREIVGVLQMHIVSLRRALA